MKRRKIRIGETWIESEEPYAGAIPRRGFVRFPDGELRTVRLNQTADTSFSVGARPSHGKRGFVSSGDDGFTFTPLDNA